METPTPRNQELFELMDFQRSDLFAPCPQYAPAVGKTVSLERWDKTEPPWSRMGTSVVIAIETGQYCQTGMMVTVRNAAGKDLTLDANWLEALGPPAEVSAAGGKL